jgi:succinoglycan biosynthesis transport protein ExoP
MSEYLPQSQFPRSAGGSDTLPALALARDTAEQYGGPFRADSHLLDYVKVVYHRRWAAATAMVCVVLAAMVYTFTAVPIFEARAQLLIEAENPNVVSFKEVIDQEKTTNDYYQTQYRILQSRTLARRTLDRLQLWPQFDSSRSPRPTIGSVLGPLVGQVTSTFRTASPSDPPAPDETAAQSRIIDQFLANLTISPIRNSRLVDVRYESPSAERAAQVANGLARCYIEQSLEFKYTASKEASDWLGDRLGEQRQRVEASEAALQQYRERSDAMSLEERQNIVVQKLADLNAAVTRAKTERIQKEATYQQIRNLQNDRAALDTVPTILSNQFVQQQKSELAGLQQRQVQLSEKLGDRHPDMIKIGLAIKTAEAKLAGEIAKVIQSMKNDYETALAQEQSLARALEQQKQDALELNRKGIDYGVLQRDAASNRQIFDALMQRTKETGISGALKTSNIRIVDVAEVPRSPASPNKTANLLLALVGGSLLAVGLAFFFDYLDNRIKSPAEVKVHLGVPFLGMVPAVTGKAAATGTLLTHGTQPNFAEAFRMIRTNVLFSWVEDAGRSIVVTSTGPGEGKTLVASNLAVALSQTGERVLLIDADMRRPRVHEVFDDNQEPGLSNVLVGTTKASEAVRSTSSANLWVLPAGHIPPNPAELLGSKRFKDLLATLNEHFQWVVIDSPPVMAVADAPIAAHIAHGVVFVVGAEMTGRNLAQTALEQLSNANAHVLGVVLNRVDLERNAYYYSQYYRREYGAYYTKSAPAKTA